ncbi:MAG: hypothetical protein HQ567_26675 [Candidatus Nealsonbacteria bacterium]|nr:hypothetical protein [Candidatus Nealsonbacteria bacterium]
MISSPEPTQIGSRTTTGRRLFFVAMAGLAIAASMVNDEARAQEKKVVSGEWGVGRHDVDGSHHARQSLRLAIQDLIDTFGARYGSGAEFLGRLESLRSAEQLQQLRRDALLANPLLDFDKLILLKRKRGQLGLPVNHKCNSGIARTGYDNEIATLSLRKVVSGEWGVGRHNANGSPYSSLPTHHYLRTLFRPKGTEFVGEIDLHFDADRLLFTMPNGRTWQIHEIRTDGSGLRQLSRGEHPDVDNFDACYLPDGRIVFASTASYHAVPCWHGKERACALYVMEEKVGSGQRAVGRHDANESPHSPLTTHHSPTIRQLCFDQDLDLHPAVLPNGQIIFSRWDYTGPMHIYLRPLMAMNPDGTAQRAIYGSNSYWPNALYYPRGIPGTANKIVAIVAGYHGVPRMGELVVLDTTRGWPVGRSTRPRRGTARRSRVNSRERSIWATV